MSYFLREITYQEDKELMERFEKDRHHIAHCSMFSYFPDVAVLSTAKKGFVQFINLATGAYQTFLTHLEGVEVPLESPLRFVALSPALYIAQRERHHIFYSLAHSNELLCANISTGNVSVIAAFTARPSAIYSDGEFVCCGSSDGEVHLWRATTLLYEGSTVRCRPAGADVSIERSILENNNNSNSSINNNSNNNQQVTANYNPYNTDNMRHNAAQHEYADMHYQNHIYHYAGVDNSALRVYDGTGSSQPSSANIPPVATEVTDRYASVKVNDSGSILWRRKIHKCGISSLSIVRDYVIIACTDFTVFVHSILNKRQPLLPSDPVEHAPYTGFLCQLSHSPSPVLGIVGYLPTRPLHYNQAPTTGVEVCVVDENGTLTLYRPVQPSSNNTSINNSRGNAVIVRPTGDATILADWNVAGLQTLTSIVNNAVGTDGREEEGKGACPRTIRFGKGGRLVSCEDSPRGSTIATVRPTSLTEHNNFIIVGTDDGRVLLIEVVVVSTGQLLNSVPREVFTVDIAEAATESCGIAAAYITQSDQLVVFSTGGEVWRWPMRELMAVARPPVSTRTQHRQEEEALSDGDVSVEVVEEEEENEQGSAHPPSSSSHPHQQQLQQQEDEDDLPAPAAHAPPTPLPHHSDKGYPQQQQPPLPFTFDEEENNTKECQPVEDDEAATTASLVPPSSITNYTAQHTQSRGGGTAGTQSEAEANALIQNLEDAVGGEGNEEGQPQQQQLESTRRYRASVNMTNNISKSGRRPLPYNPLQYRAPEPGGELTTTTGVVSVHVEGLKEGRRMDPRRIEYALRSATAGNSTQSLEENTNNNNSGSNDNNNNNKLLVASGTSVLPSESTEDKVELEKYMEEHPTVVTAARFSKPVKLPRYGLHDQVFVDAPPLSAHEEHQVTHRGAGTSPVRSLMPPPPAPVHCNNNNNNTNNNDISAVSLPSDMAGSDAELQGEGGVTVVGPNTVEKGGNSPLHTPSRTPTSARANTALAIVGSPRSLQQQQQQKQQQQTQQQKQSGPLIQVGNSVVSPSEVMRSSPTQQDDLIDVTFLKMAKRREALALVREQQKQSRRGPDINAHGCEDLLFPHLHTLNTEIAISNNTINNSNTNSNTTRTRTSSTGVLRDSTADHHQSMNRMNNNNNSNNNNNNNDNNATELPTATAFCGVPTTSSFSFLAQPVILFQENLPHPGSESSALYPTSIFEKREGFMQGLPLPL